MELFEKIPKCLMEYFLSFLTDKNDLLRLACVNKRFNVLVDNCNFWKHFICKSIATLIHSKGDEYSECSSEFLKLSKSKVNHIIGGIIEYHQKQQNDLLRRHLFNDRITVRLNVLKALKFKLNNKELYNQLIDNQEVIKAYSPLTVELISFKYLNYPFLAFENLWNHYKCVRDLQGLKYHHLSKVTTSEKEGYIQSIHDNFFKRNLEYFNSEEQEDKDELKLRKLQNIAMLRVFCYGFESCIKKIGDLDIVENLEYIVEMIDKEETPLHIKIKAIDTLKNKKLKKNDYACSTLRALLTKPSLRSYALETLVFLRDTDSIEQIYSLCCNNTDDNNRLKNYVNALAMILRTQKEILGFCKKILEIGNEESLVICLSIFAQHHPFELICKRDSKNEVTEYIESFLQIFDEISNRFEEFTNNLLITYLLVLEAIFSSALFLSSCKWMISSKQFKNIEEILFTLNKKHHKTLPIKGDSLDMWLTRATAAYLNFFEQCFPLKKKKDVLYEFLFESVLISTPEMISFIWHSTNITFQLIKETDLRLYIKKLLTDLKILDPYHDNSQITHHQILLEKKKICSVHNIVSNLYSIWEKKVFVDVPHENQDAQGTDDKELGFCEISPPHEKKRVIEFVKESTPNVPTSPEDNKKRKLK